MTEDPPTTALEDRRDGIKPSEQNYRLDQTQSEPQSPSIKGVYPNDAKTDRRQGRLLMGNRQSYLFERNAAMMIDILVPKYAKAVSIKRDAEGYWLNVSWNCEVIAPLTIQETHQALGE